MQRPGVGKDPLTDPDMEAVVPVKEGEPARFFVLRSLNHDNLAVRESFFATPLMC